MSAIPENASEAVLVKSVKMPADAPTVKGHDFQEAVKGTGPDYAALLSSYRSSGFQAMNFGLAVDEIKAMVSDFSPHLHFQRQGGTVLETTTWKGRTQV